MWFGAAKKRELAPESKRWTLWLIVSTFFAAHWIAHLLLILGQGFPIWVVCFPFDLAAPVLWPPAAIGLAILMVLRAKKIDIKRSARRFHFGIAMLLLLFATDTATGGDHRWFGLAMRRELAKCGGSAPIQAWVERALDSMPPGQIGEMPLIDRTIAPAGVQRLAMDFNFASFVYGANGKADYVQFDKGSWDMGWGIVVGRRNLTMGSPDYYAYLAYRNWTKEVQPGVWLYFSED